jgi:hypothetical protein
MAVSNIRRRPREPGGIDLMKSHEVLKQVIEAVGTKQVASDLRVSSSLVYKWCAEPIIDGERDPSGARNPLDRIVQMCDSTGDRRAVEWLCSEVGGYFVESPEVDLSKVPGECIRHTQSLLSGFSTLLQVISESIANEGRIDEAESRQIRHQWHQLQSQGEAFVRACESGLFDPTR